MHQPSSYQKCLYINFGLSPDKKTGNKMSVMSNSKSAHCYCTYTTAGAKPIDSKDEILMFDDSVPSPQIRENTYTNTHVKRETLEAIIIFILKSDTKYNHIYSCLFGEHFQNIKQHCHFPVKTMTKHFSFRLCLKSFQYYMLYVHKIQTKII